MGVLFISILFLVLLAVNNGPNFVVAQMKSPRLGLVAALDSAGCTNLLIQHYIINASRSGLASTVLAARLSGVSGYNVKDADVVKWLAVVAAYDAAEAKKKKGG